MDEEKKVVIGKLTIVRSDPKNPLPLYHQVYSDLNRIIRSGVLQPGEMLPPEIELAQAYGVGRQTIRAAIARLVDEKLLERFAGIGTIVRAQSSPSKFYLDRSFTQQMAELGMKARSKVLKHSESVIESNAPAALRSKLGVPCLNLLRLRYGDDTPIGLQFTTILTEHCPDLGKFDFSTRSLYDVLAQEYHLLIVQFSHVVSATTANDFQSDLLRTVQGAPLLLVKTTAYLNDREPVEYSTSYYRADRYEFSTTHVLKEC
jgi:GntR family transcriptional regulator